MRKTSTVTIDAPGRDAGKMFQITEMPAMQAERWAYRALGVMIRGGVDMPDLLSTSGFSGVVGVGFVSLFAAPFEEVDPLLAELMGCVRAMPDSSKPGIIRGLVESDIEEAATFLKLRMEAFELSSGFSVAAALSDLKTRVVTAEITQNTQTSQDE